MHKSFKKQSKKLYIYNLLISIREIILSYPVYKFFTSLFGSKKIIFILLSLYLCIRLYHLIFEYYSIRYKFESEYFLIRKGLLNKKLISFDQHNKTTAISNVREKSNIIQNFLGIKELEIYLPNSEDGIIRFSALENYESDKIQKWLKQETKKSNTNNDKDVYKPHVHIVPIRTIILTAFLSANYIPVIPILLDIQNWLTKLNIDIKSLSTGIGLIYVELATVVALFIGIVSIQYLNFGKFNIQVKRNKLYVKNGFINEDGNIIDTHSIKGVIKHSNLGMRLLGFETLSVLTINKDQDNNGKSKNYILPYIKKEQSTTKINELIGWNIKNHNTYDKRHIWSIFIGIIPKIMLLFILLVITIMSFNYVKNSRYILILIFFTLSAFIVRPIFTRIQFNDKFIYIKQGIFNIDTFIIPYASLDHLTSTTSPIFKYKKFCLFLETAPTKKFEIIGSNIPNKYYTSLLQIK